MPKLMGRLRWALLFYFLSGVTGLVYEVLWTRRLTLTFGHTVLAVSTVLSGFMLGLALGSLFAGSHVDRWKDRQPLFFLRVYGYLELFVGLWAALSLVLLSLVERAYLALATGGVTGFQLYLACFAFSLVVLVPPTMAMGATVPVMGRLLVRESAEMGRLLSRLYGINTLGAVLGSALAGFVLLPTIGLKASLLLAAGVNVAIGAGAIVVSRSEVEHVDPVVPRKSSQMGRPAPSSRVPAWAVPLAFGAAGVASMAYQIGWNRGLSLSLGSSVYAFSSILVAFLAGLGLGSLVYPLLMGGREPRLEHLGGLQVGVGITGALTIPALGSLPLIFFQLFPYVRESYSAVIALDLGLSFVVLIIPTFLMGLAFPLASHLYARDLASLGRSVGQVYSANSLGCILGSFLAGFVLVPHLGAQRTLEMASVLNLLVGLCLWPRPATWAVGGLALAGVLLQPAWDPGLMAGGVAVYAQNNAGKDLSDRDLIWAMFRKPAMYQDGLSATVSMVVNGRDNMSMKVNGKVDASLGVSDQLTQYLMGYVPALLHPGPKKAAVIGLGSGFTLQALSLVPGIQSIECAELEPAVVAAGEYWKGWNGRILEDPRVKLRVTDGRTFILGSPERYDLICSEPSNPWIAGIGNLYTRDFYRTCRERLAPGGVMCQWTNMYAMSPDDMSMVMRGFFDSFRYGLVFETCPGDVLMVGSDTELKLLPERLRQAYAESKGMQRQFFEIGLYQPEDLVGQYLFDREKALEAFASSPFNTDDRPLLEFSAPRSLYDGNQLNLNQQLLRSLHDPAHPYPPGIPAGEPWRTALCFGYLNVGDEPALEKLLTELPPSESTALVRCELTRLQGKAKEAQALFDQAHVTYPKSALITTKMASFALASNANPLAAELFATVVDKPPAGAQAVVLQGLAQALINQQKWQEALPFAQRAADLRLSSTPYVLVASAYEGLGQWTDAAKALKAGVELNSKDFELYLHLGHVQANMGLNREAITSTRLALQLIPDDPQAGLNLGVIYKALGRRENARDAWNHVVDTAPMESDQYRAALEFLAELKK